MEIRVISDLASEPITTNVMKNRLKAKYGTDTTEDAEIASMIKSARQLIETYCNVSLGSKVIEIFVHADEIKSRRIRLPYGPHSVMTADYPVSVDQDGTETALTLNTDYYKRGNLFWELEFLLATVNPWNEDSLTANDYKIRLTAGYGITGTYATETIPNEYIEAIKIQVQQWYHNQYDWGLLSGAVKNLLKNINRNTWL